MFTKYILTHWNGVCQTLMIHLFFFGSVGMVHLEPFLPPFLCLACVDKNHTFFPISLPFPPSVSLSSAVWHCYFKQLQWWWIAMESAFHSGIHTFSPYVKKKANCDYCLPCIKKGSFIAGFMFSIGESDLLSLFFFRGRKYKKWMFVRRTSLQQQG